MRILFQGDSITDAGRSREAGGHLGVGYPTLIAARLGCDEPGKHEFLNRAVSGFRVVDLYAGWKKDALNLKPDLISILIGINDVWHEVGEKNGVEADRFEVIYDLLLSFTRERLPDTKVMVLEPFMLPGRATGEHLDYFARETRLRAEAARRVAEKHGALFVPLQAVFDEACGRAEAECWLRDGVHPTAAGHELIAREWVRAFSKMRQEV